MLNWNNLKLDIFKAINNYPLMDSLESSEEIISLSWSIPHIELGNLFPSFRGIQKYFWSNKNGDEYIGLGLCQEYKTDLDIEKLEKLINSSKNKDKKIQAFATHLFTKENDTKQVVNNSDWKNFHNSHYIVPMITIKNQSQENEQTQVIICLKSNQLNNETAKSRTIFKIESLMALNFDRLKKISIKNTTVLPNRLEWNKMLLKSEMAIKEKVFNKVVLARKKVIEVECETLAQNVFLKLLEQKDETNYLFYWEKEPGKSFLSLSPETLFCKKGNELTLDSLAGTRPRGKTKELDKKLRENLLRSQKDLNEHNFVSSWIKSNLEEISHNIETSENVSIVKLKHVQHLHTPFKSLIKNKVSIIDLINRFHPTPAIGGLPRKEALQFIKENEAFERGLYSAPLGLLEYGKAEFCVGIRSAFVSNESISIYGGAGIVIDSDAKEEWNETETKMKNFTEMFSHE